MNKLQIFNYNDKQVRTVQKDGEPWFVLKDVCEVLGLGSSHKVYDRLDEDERNQIPVIDSIGRNQNTAIINESGLYNVILRSDKPEARPFRKWVTGEVLPAIRRHGAYMTPETIEAALLNPDTIIKIATELKSEREKRLTLEGKVAADRPKVLFADAVAASESTILIGELAKLLKQNGIDIGQNRLFKRLRADGWLIKRQGSDYNMPTQKSLEMGLFKIKESVLSHADGHTSVNKTPKVTGRGQQYFIDLFLKEKNQC